MKNRKKPHEGRVGITGDGLVGVCGRTPDLAWVNGSIGPKFHISGTPLKPNYLFHLFHDTSILNQIITVGPVPPVNP